MRMYICTVPRMRTLRSLPAALALIIMGVPVFAQNSRPNRSAAQASLSISVNVVPAIIPERHHKDKDTGREHDAVSYDLTRRDDELSISSEVRSMRVEVQGGAQEQPVQMTTVVSK
jgi:hypothetical protein